jgi:hypothetical protein
MKPELRLFLVIVKLLLQADAWFVRELPGPLVCLYRSTLDNYELQTSSWTLSEVLDIARPLLGRRAENWTFKLRNARLWLLQRKALPNGIMEDKRLAQFSIELDRYTAMGRKDFASQVKYREEATSADELYEEVERLLRLKTWTERSVQPMVAKLYGLSGIDARASSPKAFAAWLEFSPRWTRFVSDHPAIAAQLL